MDWQIELLFLTVYVEKTENGGRCQQILRSYQQEVKHDLARLDQKANFCHTGNHFFFHHSRHTGLFCALPRWRMRIGVGWERPIDIGRLVEAKPGSNVIISIHQSANSAFG